MDGDLQGCLVNAYRRFTVATDVASFDKYDGKCFQILPGIRIANVDPIVGTKITTGGGNHLRLDAVMRSDRHSWHVVDIVLNESNGPVAMQQCDFRKILANADIDALIAGLPQKTAYLLGGAPSS